MIKKSNNRFMSLLFFIPIIFSFPWFKDYNIISSSNAINEISKSYPNEKRALPAYDKVIGKDGLYHFRVLFWVPNESTKLIPYADEGVVTDVSSHGPVEKWSVKETNQINGDEKLVFILVPKTFVFLYGEGFEKVIHIKYS